MPKSDLPPPEHDAQPEEQGAPAGLRGGDLGIHLVACVLLAGAAGYALDGWLGWTPWAMLVGGTLGFAAWLRLVWQAMKA